MNVNPKIRQLLIDDVKHTLRDIRAKGEVSVYVKELNTHVGFCVFACSMHTMAMEISKQIISRLETETIRLPGDTIETPTNVEIKGPSAPIMVSPGVKVMGH